MPIIAFAEACPGIGLFVSGVFLVGATSYLYTHAGVSLAAILPLAFVGALAADHSGFYLGRLLGPRWHQSRFALRHRGKVEKADALISRFGIVAIFIGRFVPAIRSIVPLAVGLSGTDRLKFTTMDVLACLLWSLGLGAILLGVERVIGVR